MRTVTKFKPLENGYEREPTTEGLCWWEVGVLGSEPCDKKAKWLVAGIPLCGIHIRTAQRRQEVAYASTPQPTGGA